MISKTSHPHEATRPGPASPVDPRVLKVIALMEENYHRELPLDVLARSVRLSRWHLGHIFKNEVGSSPSRYLRALRMRRAGLLLATTFLTVKEVMYKVGVRDQSHFAKDFKSIYGLTPTEYRAARVAARGGEGPQQPAPTGSKKRPALPIEADA